ncbi:MAG: hypothetical protein ACXABY_22615, partial [Candidatus Thorarchaeota archaeon]
MKKTIIAPVNAESEEKQLFLPIRELPTEKMVLLVSPDGIVKAEGFREDLDKLGIPVSIIKVNHTGNPWEDYFTAAADVLDGQMRDDIIINISTADRISQ